jgi:hypothetical protein
VLSLKNRTIEVSNTIRELLAGAPDYFIQIDKGTIVNMNMVSEIGFATKMLTLCNGSTVFMSRSARSKVREALQGGEGGALPSGEGGARSAAMAMGRARQSGSDGARPAAGADLPPGW